MNIYQWKNQIHNFNESFSHNEEVKDKWARNIELNIDKFTKKNSIWNLEDIYLDEKEKAAILVGASPSILDDVEKLKNIDDNFFIICANSSLKILLDHGVKPDYCMCLDGDEVDIPQHLDCDNKDITLLASCVIAPESLAVWKGPIYYQAYYSIPKKYKAKVRRALGKKILSGGNSMSQALFVSTVIFGCRTAIFVGNELCYDEHYYADKTIAKTEIIPAVFPITDIKGRKRVTIPALFTYAMWIDKTCADLTPPGFFIDCSGGILGTTNKAIHPMELSDAIEKVKFAFEKKRELNNTSKEKQNDIIKDLMALNTQKPSEVIRYNFVNRREELWKIAKKG